MRWRHFRLYPENYAQKKLFRVKNPSRTGFLFSVFVVPGCSGVIFQLLFYFSCFSLVAENSLLLPFVLGLHTGTRFLWSTKKKKKKLMMFNNSQFSLQKSYFLLPALSSSPKKERNLFWVFLSRQTLGWRSALCEEIEGAFLFYYCFFFFNLFIKYSLYKITKRFAVTHFSCTPEKYVHRWLGRDETTKDRSTKLTTKWQKIWVDALLDLFFFFIFIFCWNAQERFHGHF